MKQLIKFFTIKFLILASAYQAEALINSHQGSLEVDISSDLNSRLPFSLHYSSRSLYTSLFGRGWCSSFDISLVKEQVIICDRAYSRKSIKIKRADSYTAITVAAKTFYLDQHEQAFIWHKKKRLYFKDLHLIQEGPLLRKIQFSALTDLDFFYDEMDNLIEIKDTKRSSLLIASYDTTRDLLESLKIAHGCSYILAYKMGSPLTFTATLTTVCDQLKTISLISYEHKRSPAGELYLAHVDNKTIRPKGDLQ